MKRWQVSELYEIPQKKVLNSIGVTGFTERNKNKICKYNIHVVDCIM